MNFLGHRHWLDRYMVTMMTQVCRSEELHTIPSLPWVGRETFVLHYFPEGDIVFFSCFLLSNSLKLWFHGLHVCLPHNPHPPVPPTFRWWQLPLPSPYVKCHQNLVLFWALAIGVFSRFRVSPVGRRPLWPPLPRTLDPPLWLGGLWGVNGPRRQFMAAREQLSPLPAAVCRPWQQHPSGQSTGAWWELCVS